MTDEENSLEASLKSLEISSDRLPSVAVWDEFLPLDMNPFQRRPRSRSTGSICTCMKRAHQLNEKSRTSFKRNAHKLLKDPVLKYVTRYPTEDSHFSKTSVTKSPSNGVKAAVCNQTNKSRKPFGRGSKVQTDFKSLLDGCERLTIGTEFQRESFQSARNKSVSAKNQDNRSSGNASCSQEAIARMGLNAPCDVTMDELASYFETFVHIPKKMSSMAEMMYI